MTYKEITELIKLVKKLELGEFKLRDGEFQLSVRSNQEIQMQVPSVAPLMAAPQQIAQVQSPIAAQPVAIEAPKETPTSSSTGEEVSEENYLEVKSPIVGTFYRSPSPDKPVYIKVGDTIDVGSVVCIVEAMKLFNEIESEISGKVVKVMIEDASPVEYDQVLFLVDPKG